MNRTFDRLVQFDDRSRLFAVREALPTKKFRNYTWPCNTFNDQGSEGACVGFAISHELSAVPLAIPTNDEFAYKLYRRAQQLDPWPGENYSGTSVLAGMKALQEAFPEYEYRWGFGLEDMARAVGSIGPAIVGLNWYSGMFDTDYRGYVTKSGYIAGGHAIMARGVRCVFLPGRTDKTKFENIDLVHSYFVLHNSWGIGWGTKGTCKISFLDMDALLREAGECVIPIKRK